MPQILFILFFCGVLADFSFLSVVIVLYEEIEEFVCTKNYNTVLRIESFALRREMKSQHMIDSN